MSARPAVSIVVPFLGDASAARRVLDQLGSLALAGADEVVVADNTAAGTVPEPGPGRMRVVRAAAEQSAFHARNAGAEAALNDWLLFIDADCRPAPRLADAYFADAVEDGCGLLAGAVRPLEAQPGLIPAYARSRGHLSEEFHLEARPEWPHPSGITGNMMVRRRAWDEVGGFQEGLRAGADIEFCWRVQDAGWTLRHVPGARVAHAHVESLRALLRQANGHAAGMKWVNRRYPGSYPRPRLAQSLGRCAAGSLIWAVTGRGRRSLYKLIDAAWLVAYARGYHAADNRAPRREGADPGSPPGAKIVLAVEFPRRGLDEAMSELSEAGSDGVCVEALARPERPAPSLLHRVRVTYAEDDSPIARAAAMAWLAARHPIRCARSASGESGPGLALLAPAGRRCLRRPEARLVVSKDEVPGAAALERLRALVEG